MNSWVKQHLKETLQINSFIMFIQNYMYGWNLTALVFLLNKTNTRKLNNDHKLGPTDSHPLPFSTLLPPTLSPSKKNIQISLVPIQYSNY